MSSTVLYSNSYAKWRSKIKLFHMGPLTLHYNESSCSGHISKYVTFYKYKFSVLFC